MQRKRRLKIDFCKVKAQIPTTSVWMQVYTIYNQLVFSIQGKDQCDSRK